MKSISKIYLSGALMLSAGLVSCVGDLDQMPEDPTVLTAAEFQSNPKEYIGGAIAKCYSGLAVSGQKGAGGDSDIKGLDGGTANWARVNFMLSEFPTDECIWKYADPGVIDLCITSWADNNEMIYGAYSRLYTHIAVCNDFIRLVRNAGDYNIKMDADLQKEADQLVLEARALRGLSYYYVIDYFGNAAYAWDTQITGEEPPQMTRAELFNHVTADLEDVLSKFSNATPVYGRIGKDAVEALLVKFYLNAQVYTGTAQWQKCWDHAQNIINRHKGGGYNNSGLANDYLALFCGNNDMFAPGGSLPAQNEILWNIPYEFQLTEAYGGTTFLLLAPLYDDTPSQPAWYGISGQWSGCMRARQQFCEKFNFSDGVSGDLRTYLWLTDSQGFHIQNTVYSERADGYVPLKFSNVKANADGTLPRWNDPETGLPRVGVHDLNNSNNYGVEVQGSFANTDLPLIRLAEIYLSAAEANLRGNVGDRAEALKYVNYVRGRAGVRAWNTGEFTLDNILDERARELYWEMNRRNDLVRFDKFAGGNYNWAWKNNVQAGAAIGNYMNLYPIPTKVINSYTSTYKQNSGY